MNIIKEGKQSHATDESELVDVIFLFQRPGVTKEDIVYMKNFIRTGIMDLPLIGKGSRIAVSFFTGLSYHPIELDQCCKKAGVIGPTKLVDSLTFDPHIISRPLDQRNHPGGQINTIDVKFAFQSIYERYLSRNEAEAKSTLIVFVANFVESTSYFQLLDDAIEDIEDCKNAGAYLIVIIVDPKPYRDLFNPEDKGLLLRNFEVNRRKRVIGKTISQQILEDLRTFLTNKQNSEASDDAVNRNQYLVDLFKKFERKLDDEDLNWNFPRVNKASVLIPKGRADSENKKSLTLIYAQELASRPDYGLHIESYAQLNLSSIGNFMRNMLLDPYRWFGDGKVKATCPETNHMVDRAIWSPGYNSMMSYPSNTNCSWLIRARRNHYVSLRFDHFNSENTFDVLTAYNGNEKSDDSLLAILTGYYEQEELPVVKSITEEMLLIFQTDSTNNFGGFHAVWEISPIRYVFKDTDAVFLLDVSGSIFNAALNAAKSWIRKSLDFFFFQDEISSADISDVALPRLVRQKSRLKSKTNLKLDLDTTLARIGLLSFGTSTTTILSNEFFETKSIFLEKLQSVKLTIENTLVGGAIEYAKTRQFLLRNEEENYNPYDRSGNLKINRLVNGRTKDCSQVEIAPRILFLFTDGYFYDDPAVAAQQLCAHNILLVVISIGNYNLRSIAQLTDMCGIMFRVTLEIPDVMEQVRCKLGLRYTMTSYVEILTTTAKNDTPSTVSRSTTSITPKSKSRVSSVTPKIIYVQPELQKFNYWGLAILLIVLCGIETLLWICLIVFLVCLTPAPIRHPEDIQEVLEKQPGKRSLYVNENEKGLRRVLNLPLAELDKPVPVNSFFIRHAVTSRKPK